LDTVKRWSFRVANCSGLDRHWIPNNEKPPTNND
jgi:hypothetical protein